MKYLVVLALLAAVSLAATVTLKAYDDKFRCQGSFQTYTLQTGTCESGDAKRDISGVEFACPTGNGTTQCANLEIFMRSDNCTDFGMTNNIVCGKCNFEPRMGWYKYHCDPVTKTVIAHHQCDKTCATCNTSHTLVAGQCAHFSEHNFTHSLRLNNISTCPPFITEQVWYNGTLCAGGTENTFDLEEGVCYEGYTFQCSSGAHKKANKPAPRGANVLAERRKEFLRRRAMNDALVRMHGK